jgi:hybrid cluster-associated redox disulfide protein
VKTKKIKIDPNISIPELIERYPQLEKILLDEFGFHCASCIFAEFDTLEEGARLHGIEGPFFEEMLEYLEKILNEPEK